MNKFLSLSIILLFLTTQGCAMNAVMYNAEPPTLQNIRQVQIGDTAAVVEEKLRLPKYGDQKKTKNGRNVWEYHYRTTSEGQMMFVAICYDVINIGTLGFFQLLVPAPKPPRTKPVAFVFDEQDKVTEINYGRIP